MSKNKDLNDGLNLFPEPNNKVFKSSRLQCNPSFLRLS